MGVNEHQQSVSKGIDKHQLNTQRGDNNTNRAQQGGHDEHQQNATNTIRKSCVLQLIYLVVIYFYQTLSSCIKQVAIDTIIS